MITGCPSTIGNIIPLSDFQNSAPTRSSPIKTINTTVRRFVRVLPRPIWCAESSCSLRLSVWPLVVAPPLKTFSYILTFRFSEPYIEIPCRPTQSWLAAKLVASFHKNANNFIDINSNVKPSIRKHSRLDLHIVNVIEFIPRLRWWRWWGARVFAVVNCPTWLLQAN